jgi:phosphoglycolate phosphatase-like HAD superfamily hydrolase
MVMWKRLLLFDIDGTLLTVGNSVHGKAFDHAVRTVTGKHIRVASADPYGRTDTSICLIMLALAGLEPAEAQEALPRVFGLMVDYYLEHEVDLRAHILPGVREILEFLVSDGAYLTAILTGNLEPIGWHKLKRAHLAQYFSFGAFGDASAERNDLVGVARLQARQRFGRDFDSRDIVVIGDTPRDIACGKANGTITVGVATGSFTWEQLTGKGADVIIGGLGGSEGLRPFLESL